MVNPFAISWLWRGFKGSSVTFALLFASFMVGLSLSRYVQIGLTKLGVHWLYVILIPVVFFSLLAKWEERFLPDEKTRKRWARGLIIGSIVLAILIAWIRR